MIILTSGTKEWILSVGVTASGPWNKIAGGELPDPKADPNKVPLIGTTLSGYNMPAGQVSYEVCHVISLRAKQIAIIFC